MNTSLNLENTTISSNVCSCFKWCCLNEKERDCAGNYEHNLYTSHLSSQANAESFPHRKKRNHLSHIGSHLHSQCPSTSTSYIRVWYIINTYHTKLSEKRHGTSMGIVAFQCGPRPTETGLLSDTRRNWQSHMLPAVPVNWAILRTFRGQMSKKCNSGG